MGFCRRSLAKHRRCAANLRHRHRVRSLNELRASGTALLADDAPPVFPPLLRLVGVLRDSQQRPRAGTRKLALQQQPGTRSRTSARRCSSTSQRSARAAKRWAARAGGVGVARGGGTKGMVGRELPGVHDGRGRCTGELTSTLLSCILTRSTDTLVARRPSPLALTQRAPTSSAGLPSFGRLWASFKPSASRTRSSKASRRISRGVRAPLDAGSR